MKTPALGHGKPLPSQTRQHETGDRLVQLVSIEKLGMPRHFAARAQVLRLDVMVEPGRESRRQRFESR